jgi:hypothetical protein
MVTVRGVEVVVVGVDDVVVVAGMGIIDVVVVGVDDVVVVAGMGIIDVALEVAAIEDPFPLVATTDERMYFPASLAVTT